MPVANLVQRSVLKLSGPDVRAFLQGQFTQDLDMLSESRPLYAGYLSPQGKTLFALFLFAAPDGGIWIDCATSQVEALAKRLAMFRLRRAVQIEQTGLAVFASWGEVSRHWLDPRLAAAGSRWVANPLDEPATASLTDWHAHRLPLALPEADEIGSDELLWLETNARSLNGVSFTKGCYVGQENTARMHHRGKVRKMLLAVRVPRTLSTSSVMAGTKEAGSLRGEPHEGLQMALIRSEFLSQSLSIQGEAVELVRPAWLTPEVDEEG